jgi:hypothetical protein
MNNIPYNLRWGIDLAIKKLRPKAYYQISNNNFKIWYDPDGKEPPTWEEIYFQANEDQNKAIEWAKNSNVEIDFKELRPLTNKICLWNEEENVWEEEPDYEVK